MSVLAQIIERTRSDLDATRLQRPLDQVAEQATWRLNTNPPRDVLSALRAADIAVIAEVKRRSPSAGALAGISDPAELARQYVAGGASMISVLTEPHWFAGSLADLVAVRAAVDVPVLRKDFVVDEYQIVEACAAGADAVLLIVAALSDAELSHLLAVARQWQLTALVEVHDRAEAERAARAGAVLVGVNARDLVTLEVNPGTFADVVDALGNDCLRVAESGLRNPADVASVAAAGADCVLIGQALVESDNPTALIARMKEVARDARR